MKRSSQIALPVTAPSQPRSRSSAQIVERRDPSGRDHRQACLEHALQQRKVRARERSVPLCARHQHPADAGGGAAAASSPGVSSAERVQPCTVTVPWRASIATATPSPNLAAAADRNSSSSAAVPTSTRAAPACERGLDRVKAAIAAADLHGRPDRCDARDEAEVGIARERAVEVDEVQPGGALGRKALGCRDRVAALDGHRLPAALREANDTALENVDRRVDREVFAS